MLLIPLSSTPSQTVNVNLAGQACTIAVYQRFWGVFCDLFVNTQPIIRGVLCLNQTFIVRDIYLGFTGDLAFVDTQGSSDPSFSGIGTRFLLLYLTTADLPPGYGISH